MLKRTLLLPSWLGYVVTLGTFSNMQPSMAWQEPPKGSPLAKTSSSERLISISLVQVKDEKKENKDIQEASTLALFNLEMEILESVIMTALALYRICCYMEHSTTSSLKQAHHFVTHLPTFLLQAIHYRCIQQHARHCAFFSTTDSSSPKPACSRFDTDSFKFGIDTLCSVTMSARKECFQDLKPVEGATVTGIAGGIVVNAQCTFCFNIESVTKQLWCPRGPRPPGIPCLFYVLPSYWVLL